MKKLKKAKIITLAILFAALVGAGLGGWFGNLRPKQVEAQNQTVLILEAAVSQPVYLRLEPIVLTYKLSNPNNVSVTWSENLFFGRNTSFIIRKNNGDPIRYKGTDYLLCLPIPPAETVLPGKTKTIRGVMDALTAERLFSEPGHYSVRVEFNFAYFLDNQRQQQQQQQQQQQHLTVVSNSFDFEVAEPQGVNREAYNYIKNTLQPARNNDNGEEMIKAYKYFVDTFRDSVYWKYQSYELGYLYVQMNDYEKAEEVFYEVSDIDFYYSVDVENYLSMLAGKIGRPTRRTKRPSDTKIPVAVPRPAPPPRIVAPLPADAPVPRRLSNPNPNATP
ncbi:MAG: tetratricopeptide repeat protein [Acidobacteriota bacterium]|nr:tetratricopeptide repeat protein [Acidobacteriota bacterium]